MPFAFMGWLVSLLVIKSEEGNCKRGLRMVDRLQEGQLLIGHKKTAKVQPLGCWYSYENLS